MQLSAREQYEAHGLSEATLECLAALGDLVLGAGFNVTGITDPAEIERVHFLDSLSLLSLPCVRGARNIVDVGSGAGFPALVLAIVLPAEIVAVESHHKKCLFIEEAAQELSLGNVVVRCARAEDYGRGEGRESHEVAVSRALASLSAVAEYSLPLLVVGGSMVAMKGAISDQERIPGEKALGILGGDSLEAIKLEPFPGAENRWAYVARKTRSTPPGFPRRVGVPTKRPLGA